MARIEARAKEQQARWTPELEAKVTHLIETDYETNEDALQAILASEHRSPGNPERDVYRHPLETLTFFGLKPTMHVFEVGQGAGWYTEILAPYLAKDGQLDLAGAKANSDDPQEQIAQRRAELFVQSSGNLYEHVKLVEQPSPGAFSLGEPASLDMVLVFRMFHNVHRADLWDQLMPAIHHALKDGSVLAVIQHRAADDANPDESAPQGYLPQPWLIKTIEHYGFKLEASSEINANPKDTKDYSEGVWTLPPVLALEDQDRDRYLAIGESDRTTLKFIKVAKP